MSDCFSRRTVCCLSSAVRASIARSAKKINFLLGYVFFIIISCQPSIDLLIIIGVFLLYKYTTFYL